MATTRFVPRPGWEEALLRSTELRDWLQPIADAAKADAVANAPERLGYLKGSIEAVVDYSPRHRALVVHLYASDFKAWWAEAGTSDTPAQPFLVPAIERAAPLARWGP